MIGSEPASFSKHFSNDSWTLSELYNKICNYIDFHFTSKTHSAKSSCFRVHTWTWGVQNWRGSSSSTTRNRTPWHHQRWWTSRVWSAGSCQSILYRQPALLDRWPLPQSPAIFYECKKTNLFVNNHFCFNFVSIVLCDSFFRRSRHKNVALFKNQLIFRLELCCLRIAVYRALFLYNENQPFSIYEIYETLVTPVDNPLSFSDQYRLRCRWPHCTPQCPHIWRRPDENSAWCADPRYRTPDNLILICIQFVQKNHRKIYKPPEWYTFCPWDQSWGPLGPCTLRCS